MLIALGVLAFVLGFVLDVVDTLHKIAIENRSAALAANASVSMYALGLVGAWAAIDVSMWLAIPTCIGLWFGSFLAVRRARQTPPDGPT